MEARPVMRVGIIVYPGHENDEKAGGHGDVKRRSQWDLPQAISHASH